MAHAAQGIWVELNTFDWGYARSEYELTSWDILNMMTETVLFPVAKDLAQRSPVAVLIPEDISATAVPPGERKFHSFLKILFESRPDVVGWHSVRVCNREIDFALLLPGIGLLLFEVKDWKHGNILSTSPTTFVLRTDQGEDTKTSPYVQARECGYRVRGEIQREPLLCQSSGQNKGKPILPVGHVVVFANIPRKKAQSGPHAARLDPQVTLFEDDLANDGPYLAHPKEGLKAFLEFARRALPVTFPVRILSGPQYEALKKKVFADSVIKMVDSTQRRQSRKVGEVAMDHLQEKYAREIGGGPRLLKGVAGSGKTLVLLQRAIYKAKYDPSVKRILFTCYNLALANHVRDMVAHNVSEDRRTRITVKPFFDLCGDILSETVAQEGKTEYFNAIISRAGEHVGDFPEEEKFDVILLDEGQDFSPAMFRIVLSLRRWERDDVMIAIDAEQDLYGRFSLKELGFDFRGRTHVLPASYRCTQQIFDYAHRLAGKELPPVLDRDTGQMIVFPQYVGRTGSAPVVETFPDSNRLIGYLENEIRHLIQVEKVPPAEIGILYLSKRTRPDAVKATKSEGKILQSFRDLGGMMSPPVGEKPLPEQIVSRLRYAGIPATWFTENSLAKQSFDLHEPTVKIGTIHSAKGLDFEVAYLVDSTGILISPQSNNNFPSDDVIKKNRNLLFVGCTRGRESLSILSIRPSIV